MPTHLGTQGSNDGPQAGGLRHKEQLNGAFESATQHDCTATQRESVGSCCSFLSHCSASAPGQQQVATHLQVHAVVGAQQHNVPDLLVGAEGGWDGGMRGSRSSSAEAVCSPGAYAAAVCQAGVASCRTGNERSTESPSAASQLCEAAAFLFLFLSSSSSSSFVEEREEKTRLLGGGVREAEAHGRALRLARQPQAVHPEPVHRDCNTTGWGGGEEVSGGATEQVGGQVRTN